MANSGTISLRVIPIAQAIPRRTSARRAEVLSTLRKHGASHYVTRPSQGDAMHHCLGSGYDLIFEVPPAPYSLACCH